MNKIISNKNSKNFNILVGNIFFSENNLNQELNNINPFFSSIEQKLKEEIKKIKDQRCLGLLNISIVKNKKTTSYIEKHREQGNIKARLIKSYNINDELIIINTAGGLTSGDINFCSIRIGSNVVLNITTQSMEKVYKCKNFSAKAYTNIIVGANSYISWMPLETIFFNGGKLRKRINIDIEKNSNFLGVETMIFGRQAMGEVINNGELDDAWQVNKGGKLIYSDFNRISGNINKKINNSFILMGNKVFCNIIYTGKKIKLYAKNITKYLNKSKYFAGVSIVNGVLLLKVLAKDIIEIRSFLDDLIIIFDHNFNLPKIWSC
jgi:urease accessory protein